MEWTRTNNYVGLDNKSEADILYISHLSSNGIPQLNFYQDYRETHIKFCYLSNPVLLPKEPLFPETFILKKENEPKGTLW